LFAKYILQILVTLAFYKLFACTIKGKYRSLRDKNEVLVKNGDRYNCWNVHIELRQEIADFQKIFRILSLPFAINYRMRS
jgi:hypothetical protein